MELTAVLKLRETAISGVAFDIRCKPFYKSIYKYFSEVFPNGKMDASGNNTAFPEFASSCSFFTDVDSAQWQMLAAFPERRSGTKEGYCVFIKD